MTYNFERFQKARAKLETYRRVRGFSIPVTADNKTALRVITNFAKVSTKIHEVDKLIFTFETELV